MRSKIFLINRLLSMLLPVVILASACHRNSEGLSLIYPFDGSLFPPEFPAPTFKWVDKDPAVQQWEITLTTHNHDYTIKGLSGSKSWQPEAGKWDSLKILSDYRPVRVSLRRIQPAERAGGSDFRSTIRIAEDEVGAPILYREIPLPFAYAEKYPDSMAYKLVDVGHDGTPHVAMKKFMVCGNCHSFSDDGRTIGLDFDAAHRDKGGYFIASIDTTIVFDTSTYLSWNKLQDRNTFGMFSKLSPDGRYVATTIKDRVISENFGFSPEVIPFSQLFFPINGVIAIYDRQTGKIWELPGANDPQYVQSNVTWTPDGKHLVFARARAFPYRLQDDDNFLLDDEEVVQAFVNREKEFKFDLCIVPFNGGSGGEAKLIEGASENGMSNYFPAVSPDGKWLVFCQAENFMLLQPDSRLYIVPLEGGKARKMKANLPLMNSWHAWSPNGKWMVFSSKGLSVYTDLMLTHIDEKGNASYPVVIEKARRNGRAANYPEFVNLPADYTFDMIYKYVNLDHITRAMLENDTTRAMELYDQYIEQDQYSLPMEYVFLGRFNLQVGRYQQAERFLLKAMELDPHDQEAIELLALVRSRM